MHTVIGLFDERDAATRAVESLKKSGFTNVQLQAKPLMGDSSEQATDVNEADEGFFSSVAHFFSSLFGTDDSGRTGTYTEAVRRGGYVVTVDANTAAEADDVAAVMNDEGAVDIDERASEWKSQGWQSDEAGASAGLASTGSTVPNSASTQSVPLSAASASSSSVNNDDKVVLPVIEEELVVGKRTVQHGGVRVVQRVTETPTTESVTLREEHANIERRPADRVATHADLSGLGDVSIEVRESAEEAVVSKQARVVEEVIVGKQASERTEQISDTVRRTDVDVQSLEEGSTAGTAPYVKESTLASDTSTDPKLRPADLGAKKDL